MSNFIERLADRGDAANARFSERHLPQSDEAIERRRNLAEKAIKIALAATTVSVLGGGAYLAARADDNRVANIQKTSQEGVYQQSTLDKGRQPLDRTTIVPTPEHS